MMTRENLGSPTRATASITALTYDICSGYRGAIVFVDYRDNHVSGKSWLYGE
jgi:hypothetical protein